MPIQLAPPPTTGPPTASAPLNTAIGAGYFGGTNYVTSQATGGETLGLAALLTLFFQWFKERDEFNQQRHAVLALILLGMLLSLALAAVAIYIGHADSGQAWVQAIPRAGAVAWQAQQNYLASRAAGLGGLQPASTMPT